MHRHALRYMNNRNTHSLQIIRQFSKTNGSSDSKEVTIKAKFAVQNTLEKNNLKSSVQNAGLNKRYANIDEKSLSSRSKYDILNVFDRGRAADDEDRVAKKAERWVESLFFTSETVEVKE